MKSQKISFFLLIVCLGLQACGGKYGSLGKADDEVPPVAKLRKGTLPSGLTYYLLENKKPENRAYLRLAVNAGSVLEEDNEQGIAHFVEHLAFENTARFPNQELIAYLRSLGMSFGADVNASTGFDSTQYDIIVPTEEASGEKAAGSGGGGGVKTIPDKAFEIIDDWSHSVLFKQDGIDKERKIILEEDRARSGVGQRLMKVLFPLLFKGSKYAERLPIGKMDIVQNADAALLEGFYDKWYTADKMGVVIVGDFDAEQTEKKLADYFTVKAPAQKTARPEYPLPPPEQGSHKAEIFTDSELKSTSINLYYKMNYEPLDDKLENYREDLVDSIIYRILSERFNDAEQEVDTPYFSAGAYKARYARTSLHYVFGAAAKQGQFKESLEALLKAKEAIVRYGFSPSEVKRAKDEILSEAETSALEKDKINSSEFLSAFSSNFLKNAYVSDFEWDLKAVNALLPSISVDELNQAAKGYFKEDDVLVFVSAGDSEPLLSKDEIINMVNDAPNWALTKPAEAVISESLIKELPQKGKIISEERDKDTQTLVLTLSNGAKVLLKPTENQNDEVLLVAEARGGISSVAQDAIASARVAGEAAQMSGLGDFKLSDLSKKLAGKQVSISFNNSTWTRTVEGSSRVADLKTFFELLYLGFTAPRVDEDMISILKDQYKSVLANKENNPESYFSDELTKVIYGNNPYMAPFQLSDLDKIDIDKIRAFIAKTRNPADYTFVFAGNIDESEVKKLAETYLASIPDGGKERFDEWQTLNIDFPGAAGNKPYDKKLYKGKENKSIVYQYHSTHDDFSLEGSLTADLLDGYLDIVLNDEIREKLTGVYGISPSASLSVFPQGRELSVAVYFVCGPDRVEELSSAVEAVLFNIANGAINNDTFEKARLSALNSIDDALQSNSYIASRFANYSVILGLPLSDLYRKKEIYQSIKPYEVRDMVKKLLESGLVRVVLYPNG